MKLILLRGYPGAGKTTLGKRLEKAGYGKLVDTNYMLFCVSQLIEDAFAAIDVYDQLIVLERTIITQLLTKGRDVIVARGFSGAAAVSDYTELAEEAGGETYVIRLDAPRQELERRIMAPDRKENHSFLVTPELFNGWMSQHEVDPVDGELAVDTTKPIDDCLKDVIEYIRKGKS